MEWIKMLILSIVEGITEWLPISSTGHMILVNEIMKTEGFLTADVFLYVIQLGAILAIVTLYFHKLNPFSPRKSKAEKQATWQMWFKVIAACIPAAVIGLLLDSLMAHFENWYVVSATLIVYGIAFLLIENKKRRPKIQSMQDMTYQTALGIGLFQVLSIIPGTSRSGATILGAMILGCSREISAEFSFFLAIPVMFGVSFLKLITNDYIMTGAEWGLLLTAMVIAYVVSMAAVKFLVDYVKRHDFKVFGWYRIILGILVILFFTIFR